jgi:uncharacterized protein
MTSLSRPGVFVNTSLTPLASSPGLGTTGQVACFAAPFNIGPTKPTLVTSWQQYVTIFGGFATANGSALHYAVFQYFSNGGSGCYVLRAPNTDATLASVTVASLTSTEMDPLASFTLTANNPGAWANNLFYEVVPTSSQSDGTATFTLNLYNGGTTQGFLVESWPAISMNPSSTRNALSLINATSGGSNYVTIANAFEGAYVPSTGASDPIGNAGTPSPLTAGSDGSTAFTDAAFAAAITTGFTGNTWNITGLASIPANLVLNVNCPGSDIAVYNAVITWAEGQGNVFVVVDGSFIGPNSNSASIAAAYVNLVSGNGGADLIASPLAAIYAPFLSISDPASASPTATKFVAPGGAVLGAWSANDSQFNVAQTPAGVQATINAVSLEAYFTPTDLSALETAQVNPIKLIPSAGFCIFGGRTLGVGFPNRYINVSRTLLQFMTDFQTITQFAIFQNNDPTLWASIANVLTNYLNNAVSAGMLASNVASTAFSVVCDSTINTPTTAQAGVVMAQVAVALVSPAEFIVINLSQTSSGTSTATVSA